WLVTGPNMAGKTTFPRQKAPITGMAQMGSFVPAPSASIGIVDRLFSRVGAPDDPPPRPSTLLGRTGRTPAHLHPAPPALPRDPRRDRTRHGHIRRPVNRLGGG